VDCALTITTTITITITGFHYYSFPTVSDTGVIVIPTSVGVFKNDRFLTVDCKPYVKNLMARRANEKPPYGTISFLEHTMEAVLVTALGTGFKLFTNVNLMYFIIHLTNLQMRWDGESKGGRISYYAISFFALSSNQNNGLIIPDNSSFSALILSSSSGW